MLGDRVGVLVGELGARVGEVVMRVGALVGETVGTVGVRVGDLLGAEGDRVGFFVGEEVTALVLCAWRKGFRGGTRKGGESVPGWGKRRESRRL